MALSIFNKNSDSSLWKVVNDTVMGGKSESEFYLNSESCIVFEGSVSLKNNGGFCSIKYLLQPLVVSEYKQFNIRIKGDGNKYQFRIKNKKTDPHSYIYSFQTSGNWEIIVIPIAALYPSFRGNTLDLPAYDSSCLEEIAFLIANKKNENFKLSIDTIELK